MEILGYLLALFVGATLGMVGSGGSILTVPILVYVFHIEPSIATGYSLFIVGTSALTGGIRQYLANQVHFKTVLFFGIPSVLVVLLTRGLLLPLIPEKIPLWENLLLDKSTLIMLFFSVVMIRASIAMLRPCKDCNESIPLKEITYSFKTLVFQGILVGLISGFVGAGGGFLIIPVLVLRLKMPMKIAVGSSLFIIAINAIIGFLGDFTHFNQFDWNFLLLFALLSILGSLIGIFISSKVNGSKLKSGLGWMVLILGIVICVKELVFS